MGFGGVLGRKVLVIAAVFFPGNALDRMTSVYNGN